MSDLNNKSYGQLFEDFVRKNIPKPDKPFTFEEVRQAVYQFKILDCMWFDGEAPETPDKIFQFYMNENWPNPFDHPEELWALSKLSLPEKIHLSRRLKRPEWLKHARMGRLTLGQFMEFYKNLRY